MGDFLTGMEPSARRRVGNMADPEVRAIIRRKERLFMWRVGRCWFED